AWVAWADILARYPLESDWAARKLEQWAASGRAVAVPAVESLLPVQWSAPANLELVQRGTLALLRQEVITCPPPQFADFLLRWQGRHPDARRADAEGLAAILETLEGFPVAAELWEQAILPGRLEGYQRHWLDERIATGQWLWVGHGDETGAGSVALLQREHLTELPPRDSPALEDVAAAQVLECLRTRGARFVPDLARVTGWAPGGVRAALWALVRRSIVSNARFAVVRRGEAGAALPIQRTPQTARSLTRGRLRPPATPEGRWFLVPWGQP